MIEQKEDFPRPNLNAKNFKLDIPKAVVVAIMIIVCLQFLAGIISIPAYFNENLYNITLPLSFLVGSLTALGVVMLFLKINFKIIQEHLLNPASIGTVGLSIFFFLFMLPFAEFLTSMVPTTGPRWLEDLYHEIIRAFEIMLDYKVAGFITVCLFAPIFEEILFRGILLRGLLQNRVHPIMAIGLSSLLFGFAHLNPWQFLGAGLLGCVFGFVYYQTKALWICILLHALNNSLSFVMMIKYETMEENISDPNNYGNVFLSFLVAIIIGWIINKLNRKNHQWT